MVKFETSHGDITLELFTEKAPITVANFLQYVDDGHFDGTVFHRVIPNFVIQGGGFTMEMDQKETREKIKNEADNGINNERGSLSMARTSEVDSATSQFFVNLRDNTSLDHSEANFGYAVFAKVVDGMDVVDEIAKVETTTMGPYQDVPAEPVAIHKASQIEQE
jgi:peptidyl-prolyl cis-trans isomerase A (cyclophilin A)